MAEKSNAQTATQKNDSAAEQAMEKLSDQLSCFICLEEYRRPRVLPCLHVFCESCLEKLIETQREKLTASCPNCSKSAPLPEGGVSNLPSAFYIQHIFEAREALEKVRNPTKAQCDKCGEGELQGFCRDCGQFICQLCLDMHHKWKELQNHEISSLDQVQETASKMVTPKRVTTLCTSHPTEVVKIYCDTCDELMCYGCAITTHRDHNYALIPDAFPKHRDHILVCLDPLKTEFSSVVETIVKLKKKSNRLDRQAVKVKRKVDAEVAKLQAILEAHRRDLHSEIDDMVHQGKKELAAQIEKHELRQTQLSSCVELVEGSLQSGTQEEVLSMKRLVEQRTQQMANEFKPKLLQLSPGKQLRVVCTDLSLACQRLGKVRFEQFEGRHFKTINNINEPRHIAFTTTEEMLVCEQFENCMTVFAIDNSYKRLRSFGNTGSDERRINQPLGVAISPDNTVFVAAGHCVKKYTLEGQFIASVASEGDGQLQFNTPWAIAYNDTNNRVYVCDTENYRIIILNHDLTIYDSFGNKGHQAGQFSEPKGISVDSKGNVLVADRFNDRIQVFNSNGHHISSITHTTPGVKLQGPVSVAVGPDDWIYVVEFDCLRVSVFNENCKYIKSFGKKGDKDGEFNNPYAIAVTDDGCIYVSDTDNDRVQIFK